MRITIRHQNQWFRMGRWLPAVGLAAACTASAHAGSNNDLPAPEVPPEIAVPEGNQVHFHGFGQGVQIYTWDGSSWGSAVPEATLFDNEGNVVSTHFAGPTWQSISGSKVVGAVVPPRVIVDPTAIPWLLLRAVSAEGPGVFANTSFIHRLNTTGGNAPSTNGAFVGQVARIPYTADYFFYQGRPSIRSIDASPNPLLIGGDFTITVTASPDVTRATATVRFHTRDKRSLEIPLTQQGSNWIGSGLVPADLRLRPHKDEAEVTVLALNAAGRRAEAVVNVDVSVPSISAVLISGVLTVFGDNRDNMVAVTRDAAGTISVFVNGSPVAISGGVANTSNTSLIRISGFGGNDVLLVDDNNGPMPPTNLSGGEGNDALTGSSNTDQLDGGPGNDILLGRDGDDTLIGGAGNDTLTGGRGVDGHFGSEGDDQIVWNPGDGSDLVEGENGQDTLVFVGANGSEAVDISPVGQRLRFFRNPGNITMDCDGIEQVVFQAAAGNDTVIVNDLGATQVRHVSIDLFGSQTNTVVINGTETNDSIAVAGSTNGVTVAGLTATVSVIAGEQTIDELIINTLGGVDAVDASGVEAGLIDLTLNGGLGDDTLIGGQGNDLLIGAQGTDVVFGGAGDDTLLWNPGDGNDVNEGQAGQDVMLFNGAGADENVVISANGTRMRLVRSPGNIIMDGNEIEVVQFNARGGADAITVNDLTGTGVSQVNLDLAGSGSSGVGDTVVIKGTTGNDGAVISGTAARVSIDGLPAIVDIVGSDPALDKLVLQMLEGDDHAEASDLLSGLINLTLDGGSGNDTLVGSAGADTLLGGEGDDVLVGGPGLDVLDGGPGDNVIIQD